MLCKEDGRSSESIHSVQRHVVANQCFRKRDVSTVDGLHKRCHSIHGWSVQIDSIFLQRTNQRFNSNGAFMGNTLAEQSTQIDNIVSIAALHIHVVRRH